MKSAAKPAKPDSTLPPAPPGMKVCASCLQILPEIGFTLVGNKVRKLQTSCNDCLQDKRNARHQPTPHSPRLTTAVVNMSIEGLDAARRFAKFLSDQEFPAEVQITVRSNGISEDAMSELLAEWRTLNAASKR